MSSYLISIAGLNTPCQVIEDGEVVTRSLPSAIDVVTIPAELWPLYHAAFGVDTLTFKYFYTPAAQVIPDFEAAAQYMIDNEADLRSLLPANDWRGVAGYRKALQRMAKVMQQFGEDAVVAIGEVDE